MKKLILCILPLLFVLCFIACSKSEKSVYDSVVEQLEEYEWSKISSYNEEQITQIEDNMKNAGIEISAGVKSITHFFTPSYAANQENKWIYVYEFETESDAKLFKQQYADNWGNAIIEGAVVVYGSAREEILGLNI